MRELVRHWTVEPQGWKRPWRSLRPVIFKCVFSRKNYPESYRETVAGASGLPEYIPSVHPRGDLQQIPGAPKALTGQA